MTNESKKPIPSSEHERKNEGGREFGHVHEPTQAQQASRNEGEAASEPQNRPSHLNQGGTQIRHTFDQNRAEEKRMDEQNAPAQAPRDKTSKGERKTA
jgi:hypothetical protein